MTQAAIGVDIGRCRAVEQPDPVAGHRTGKPSSSAVLRRCVLLLLLSLAACGESPAPATLAERAQADEVALVSAEDAGMRAAFAQARASLDGFLALALAKPAPAGLGDFAVKVPISQDGATEYFWLSDLSVDGDGYSALIANRPEVVTRVAQGQRHRFARADIVDWTYTDADTRRMHGNFTACALLAKESPAQAEEFRQQYGLDCAR
ncbi:YegJ family protein [Montanilutibacter psychrotolerans]|uniref:DUF2314 domain-containing protein n=1 Tax=Montanilutibacter psychrotolerans TaxID=1327343 RepID=A0A3M8SXR5_9GAMM|nr:DUF2314 domain-containing protein [Lysobacter psychrotolerans]RNF86161.1 DUF2314 domain-containing protein [Lysobacter psychrotolerans]